MQVAVLGAGYAGLTLARQLARSLPDADVVVVDEHDFHLVQHELHRVLREPSLADLLRVPLEDALPDASVRHARVTDVNSSAQTVTLADGDGIDYDYAAICLGARTDYHDLPGIEANALPLKRVAHAHRIRERIDEAPDGRAVIGGAGLSGVQIAGELSALSAEREDDLAVTLVEQEPVVAPGFPATFSDAVREELVARGVEVRTAADVTGADADAVEFADGTTQPYDTFVWTGGIRGPDALGDDRPQTRADLRLDDRTFVVGDAARVVDADGETVPASAAAAIREARTAADSITSLADGGRPARFRFSSPGWAVSVGDGAVVTLGPTVLRGRAARAAKATVGARHLAAVGAVEEALALLADEVG